MTRIPEARPLAQARREYKYLLTGLPEPLTVTDIRARLRGLRTEFPPRQVSSLYFDTVAYSCYEQSNAGSSARLKLRLRWYGDLTDRSALVLELKQRANHLGWKSQHRVEGVDLRTIPLDHLHRRLGSVVADSEAPVIAPIRCPVLVTTYWRHYFTTPDGAIRVTVDTGLRYLDQRLRRRLNLQMDAVPARVAVLECKLDPARGSDAARLLRPLGQRHTRFSKYCHGLGMLARF